MTKVRIDPGVCGFVTFAKADSEDGMEVRVKVKSGCRSVTEMLEKLGDTFDAYEVCLTKPGCNEFYEYAKEYFPGHAACPVIAGITKCIEAECKLALPRNSSVEFIEDKNGKD